MWRRKLALSLIDLLAVTVGLVLSVPFFLVALAPFIVG